MKKFIFFLILILAIAGTALYFGWAQQSVPPGTYGVMRSKTHGLEAKVIQDGKFRWVWYKLIPKNVQITIFNIETVKHSIRSMGNLKSGEVYAALAGLNADFSWQINGELSFNIKAEHLPLFTDRENIKDDAGLREAENRLADRISGLTLARIIGYMENDGSNIEFLLIGASVPELENEIYNNFPEIENLNCSIKVERFPDFALYKSVKALYEEYQSRQSAVLKSDIAGKAENRMEGRIRMEELTKYGELLTKYPILLQYLAIEKGLPPGASGSD